MRSGEWVREVRDVSCSAPYGGIGWLWTHSSGWRVVVWRDYGGGLGQGQVFGPELDASVEGARDNSGLGTVVRWVSGPDLGELEALCRAWVERRVREEGA